jgi:hypothetical protein
MNAILFVLRTGCQWKALDATGMCSAKPTGSLYDLCQRCKLYRSVKGQPCRFCGEQERMKAKAA